MSINVYIVDDHQLFIDGLKALFKRAQDINVVGEALTGKLCLEGLSSMDATTIDVLVTDISMPEMKGDELVEHISRLYPNIKILTLSMHQDYNYIDAMIKAGSLGYVLKNTGANDLLEAIRSVNAGKTYYSQKVQDAIVVGYSNEKVESFKKVVNIEEDIFLTPREAEVLTHILKGYSSAEIGEILGVSYHTITSHRKNINAKLGTSSLVELSRIVKEKGLI